MKPPKKITLLAFTVLYTPALHAYHAKAFLILVIFSPAQN
jgi:hypothetical protein